MGVKTLTIDIEAYTLLTEEKKAGESFSKVIKRVIKEKRGSARSLFLQLKNFQLKEETLHQIEDIIRTREDSTLGISSSSSSSSSKKGGK